LVAHKSSNFKRIIKKVNLINEWYLFLEKNGLKKKLITIP
jgi:hypothetical protein